jgi:prophage antirepressor-like protein
MWFVAGDVCRVLEIANNRDAVSDLDEDEKSGISPDFPNVGNADTRIPNRGLQIISESGLYSLIFKSRKPQAKVFRKWVTGEVLPAIRKDGGYTNVT